MAETRTIELVGESPLGWADAIRQVIDQAKSNRLDIATIGLEGMDVRTTENHLDLYRIRTKAAVYDQK
ncbi:MAG TPA: dodecin domain-containing protein [bacterium]|nr:dodecin domain-containing protein [bacterium]